MGAHRLQRNKPLKMHLQLGVAADLPAAGVDCTITANDRSSLRHTAAK